LSSVLQKYLPLQCILGPEKAIGKINLLYQYQILLKLPRGKKYNEYKENVLKSIEEFYEITAYKSIKLEAFVDV
jgi:primosomal protein N' (replication factor Y)